MIPRGLSSVPGFPDGALSMKLPRPWIRNLVLGAAVLVAVLEIDSLRRRTRRLAAEARQATEAQEAKASLVREKLLYATRCLEEAEKCAATDPARADELRMNAKLALRETPLFKIKARRITTPRPDFQRHLTGPPEYEPPGLNAARLDSIRAALSPRWPAPVNVGG